MRILKEFKEFINKGNVVDLAVAVVIGGAFGKIVSALVADLVMPLVNSVMPGGDWRKWEVTPLHFRIGDFLGTVVDFAIVSFVVFIVMVKLVGTVNRRATATKECPECLEMVPKAAKRCRACTSVLTVIALLFLAAAPASAQTNPAFAFAKPDEVKPGQQPPPAVEWKAQVKSGLVVTSGNSQTTNAIASVAVSRKQEANRFALDAAAAYGESNIIVPLFEDAANPTMITNLERRSTTSTNNWLTKVRYDRFFTANNAGYASGQAAGDRIAGKAFTGGAQVGYSRQLLKNDVHTLVAEIGYDYAHERYVQQPMRTLDPVTIHSLRLFVGEALKISDTSALTGSVEAFFNLNTETAAIDVRDNTLGVDPFRDTRVIGKVGYTATLWKRLGLSFGFNVRYDQNPAPRPVPPGSPGGSAYASTFRPFADKVDTLGDVTLVYTFI
jgi:large conductance mechanosensitive channel